MAVALPIRLTDGSASISSAVSCSDTCRASANDAASVLVSFSVTDAISVTLSESSLAVVTLSVTESARVVNSETVSVIDPNTATILASDTIAVLLASESYTLNSTSTVQDSLISGLVDSVNNLQVFTGSSTNNVSVSDSLTVRLNGIEPPAPTISASVTDTFSGILSDIVTFAVSAVASDTLAIRGTDTAATPVIAVRVPDSIGISVTEPGDQQSSFGVIESLTVQVSDSAPLISGSFSFNVTDSMAVQQSDTTSFGTVVVSAIDSSRVASSETLTNSASVSAVESLRGGLTEIISLFKYISATDQLTVTITDTAAPIFNSFVGLTVSDACAVQMSDSIAELVSFLRQFSVTDSLAVLSQEGSADQFVSLPAADQLASQASELLDIWNTQSLTESVKVGMIESGLAIPIVAVNVSAFADDTLLGTADGVASVSIVYESFEYTVSDTCSIQGSDEPRLQVGHYGEDELLVSAGDVASDTAVANSSPETWNGNTCTEHRNDKPKPWKYRFTEKLNW